MHPPKPARRDASPVPAQRRGPPLRIVWVSLLAVVIAGAIGWTVWHLRTQEQRAVAVHGVAPQPDLRDFPSALRDEIVAAETAVFERGNPAQSLARLAALYHANGFYVQAQQAYRTLRALQPHAPEWLHRAAHLHASLGEAAEAIALWRQMLELAPKYAPARVGLGETLLKSGSAAEARTEFAALLRDEPENSYAQLGLARLDIASGDWSGARTKLAPIVQRTNGLLGADLLATVYERSGASERGAALRAQQKSHGTYVASADPWIDELMDACFDTYRLALESGTAMIREDWPRAEQLIARALELAPRDANLHFHAGRLARQRGILGTAHSHLDTAVRLDPALTDAWAALVSLQQQQGQLQTAAQTLGRALAANPDSPVLLLERARFHKAQGRTEAAAADFRRVMRLRHDEAMAFIELARILLAQNRTEEGIRTLEQGLVAEPGNPIALSILTFAAIEAGQRELAERHLRHIVEHPRVPGGERARLLTGYQQKFGRTFSWDR